MRPRCVLFASLFAQACVPGAAPVSPEPTSMVGARCTQDHLAAFDPQSAVLERGPLPAMEQATEAHTEELITLPCDDTEEERRCLERTEAEATRAFPTGTVTESGIGSDREIVRAEVAIDEREEVITAETLIALAEVIAERREAGEPIVLVHAERVPAPDAERAAVIRMRLPGRSRAREALRAYLVLDAPTNPVRALLELQVRASEARLLVRAVEPQPDGSIRVELGCERAVDRSEAQGAAAAPGTAGQGAGATAPGS